VCVLGKVGTANDGHIHILKLCHIHTVMLQLMKIEFIYFLVTSAAMGPFVNRPIFITEAIWSYP
jgi:hypothetical protein